MKRLRLWATIGSVCLLAATALVALPHAEDGGAPVFSGGSYLTIIRDAGGYFASRSVITLHSDHTMLAVDSGEQGPANYFGSQLGGWKPAGNHRILGRVMDFQYPLSPNGPGVVRADYVINLAPGRRHVTGTITVTAFLLQDGNPFGEGGMPVGTFTFGGERIEP